MAQFRLATLLKLRQRDRDVAAKLVQDVRAAIEKLDERQREIDQSNRDMDNFRMQASHGAVNLQRILDAQRFQMVLAAQSEQIADHQGKLKQELERREFTLMKSQQAVKSLEKLRDQRDEQEQLIALSKQQERLDEWSSIRHATSVNHTSSSELQGKQGFER
jgi:flagellar export protein FliJ